MGLAIRAVVASAAPASSAYPLPILCRPRPLRVIASDEISRDLRDEISAARRGGACHLGQGLELGLLRVSKRSGLEVGAGAGKEQGATQQGADAGARAGAGAGAGEDWGL